MTNQASSINLQDRHKVEIQLSEEFVIKYNEHILFTLLNRTFSTSDNDIHSKEYKPEELKAIIIYNNESSAQKLIDKKELDFSGSKIRFKEYLAPPELQKSIKHIEKKDETNQLVKALKKYPLLSLILKNENWKNGLIYSIKQVGDCEIEINAEELIITTDQTQSVEDKIRNYCGQFLIKKSNREVFKNIIKIISDFFDRFRLEPVNFVTELFRFLNKKCEKYQAVVDSIVLFVLFIILSIYFYYYFSLQSTFDYVEQQFYDFTDDRFRKLLYHYRW